MEALIENLKRDLDMGNTAFSGMSQKVVSKTVSYALTAAMSDEVHIPSGGAITATLPSLTSGLRYTIISGDDSEHVITGGASKIYYTGDYGADHLTNSGRDNHDAVTTLTLNAGAIGDKIDIYCDGTNWYCYGRTRATMDATG
jgi:hypothetical protein